MPRPYIPIKQVDAPKVSGPSADVIRSGPKLTCQKVARHVQAEYSRTTVIAHISSPTTAGHAGWGKPGTEWEGVHYRSYILSTVPDMRECPMCPLLLQL